MNITDSVSKPWGSHLEVFDLSLDLYYLLLLISLFVKIKEQYKLFKRSYHPVLQTGSGWMITIMKDAYGLRPSGEVHEVFCAGTSYDECQCVSGDWIPELKCKLSLKNTDQVGSSLRRAGCTLSGTVYNVSGFLYLMIDGVSAASGTPHELYIPTAVLILGMVVLSVSAFTSEWLSFHFGLLCGATALLIHGVISDHDEVYKTINVVFSSLTISAILISYLLKFAFKLVGRIMSITLKETNSDVESAGTNGPVLIRNYTAGRIKRERISVKKIAFVMILGGLMLLGGVSSDSLLCHGLKTNNTAAELGERDTIHLLRLDLLSLFERLEEIKQKARKGDEFMIPICTASSHIGANVCLRGYSFIDNKGGLKIRIPTKETVDLEALTYAKDAFCGSHADSVLSRYYKDTVKYDNSSCLPGYYIGSRKYAVEITDYLLITEFPRDEAFDSEADRRYKRQVAAWSYFSETSKKCDECVTVSDFVKWRKEMEGALNSTIRTGKSTLEVVERLDEADDLLRTELIKFQTNLEQVIKRFAVTYTEETRSRVIQHLGLHLSSSIRVFQKMAERSGRLVQDLLIDSQVDSFPQISEGIILKLLDNQQKGLPVSSRLVKKSARLFLNEGILLLSYLTRPVKTALPEVREVFNMDFCSWMSPSKWNFVTNIIVVRNPNLDAVAFTTKTGLNHRCRSLECTSSPFIYSRSNTIRDAGRPNYYLIRGAFEPFDQRVLRSSEGFVRSDGHLFVYCRGNCTLTIKSGIQKESIIQKNLVPVEPCVRCSYELKGETGIYFESMIETTSTLVPVHILPELVDIKFMEEENNKAIVEHMNLDEVKALLAEGQSKINRAQSSLKAAQEFLEMAEKINITSHNTTNPFAKGMITIVRGLVGGVVETVESFSSLSLKILSSGIFTLLPFILAGAALFVAIFWPVFLQKIVSVGRPNPALVPEGIPLNYLTNPILSPRNTGPEAQ